MKFLIMGDIGRRELYHVGDEAMTEVAIKMLQNRGIEDITLIATDPGVATDLYGLPAVERLGIGPQWTTVERDQLLDQIVSTAPLARDSSGARLAAAVEQTDVVLIAGGGNMNQRFAHHLDERLALARLARRFHKPLLVTSQTIGPQLGKRERDQLKEMLQIATAFGLRDDDSFELAQSLAGDSGRIFRTADDGALFPSVSSSLKTPIKSERYIVASFTPDAGATGVGVQKYLDWIASSLDGISSKLDADVLLIPHAANLSDSGQILDELSDRSIVERSKSGRIEALSPMVTSEIMSVMSGALLTISTRYHPVVFGPALGIPTIGITLSDYHTVRMRGALDPLGLAAFIVPFGDEYLQEAAADVTDEHAEHRQWLEPLAREQREQQQAWWDFLAGGGQTSDPVPSFPRAVKQGVTLKAAPRAAASSTRVSGSRFPGLRRKVRGAVRKLRALGATKKSDVAAGKSASSAPNPAPSKPDVSDDSPLLSVVIPVYNVEEYLRACVDSVTSQSLKNLEVILIDDESTDSSAQIARELAQADDRIQFYTQENRGLGAVRNRGLDLARGTYIAFVDSDDIVPPGSCRQMVDSLARSGSDLAIGGVARLRRNGRLQEIAWSQDLHDRDHSTTLVQTPRLLRDFYTWNKVFDREFLIEHGFRFREGVLFEDQPVIAEILATAKSIDVLEAVTYHWRLRGDGSSLTGDMFSIPDIESRREAIEYTRDALERIEVIPEIWAAWYWTLLEHHFPYYLASTAKLEQEENYDAVIRMITSVLSPQEVLRQTGVTTPNRVLVYLALTAGKPEVEGFIHAGGRSLANAGLEQVQQGIRAEIPGINSEKLPPELRLLGREDHRLYAEITSLIWCARGKFSLQCRAGITNLLPGQELEGSLALVSGDSDTRIVLASAEKFSAAETSESEVRRWCEFTAEIDLSELESADSTAGTRDGLRFEVCLSAAEEHEIMPGIREFSGPVSHSTTPLQGTVFGANTDTLAITTDSNDRIGLQTIQRMVTSANPEIRAGEFELEIKTQTEEFEIEAVRFKVSGLRERRFIPRKTSARTYELRADISWLPPGAAAQVTAIDSRGRSRRLHGQPDISLGSGLATATNRFAALRVERHAPVTLETPHGKP